MRRSSACALDSAETQPLSPSLSTAVAMAAAETVTPGHECEGMEPTETDDDDIKRSLQRQFSGIDTVDEKKKPPPVLPADQPYLPDLTGDYREEPPMERVDNQLGLTDVPLADQLSDLSGQVPPKDASSLVGDAPDHEPALEGDGYDLAAPISMVEAEALDEPLDEMAEKPEDENLVKPPPDATPMIETPLDEKPTKDLETALDESLEEKMIKDLEQAVDKSLEENAMKAATPPSSPLKVPGSEQPVAEPPVAEPPVAEPLKDDPMVEAPPEVADDKMAEAGEISEIEDEEDEPPVVERKDQWKLRPAAKPRGRKPKAEAKPKAEPKRRGRPREPKVSITIDDIITPRVDLELPKEDAPKAKQPRKRAAKSKAGGPSKRKAVASSEAEQPTTAKEDEKNKIVWTPVSKAAAPVVAGNLKWAPVQDKPVDGSLHGEADGDQAGDSEMSSGSKDKPEIEAKGVEVETKDGAGKTKDGEGEKKDEEDKTQDVNKTFARRYCPTLTPARERWIMVSEIFNKRLRPLIEKLGFRAYPYEAWVQFGTCPF